jgi:hypothetical protein
MTNYYMKMLLENASNINFTAPLNTLIQRKASQKDSLAYYTRENLISNNKISRQ